MSLSVADTVVFFFFFFNDTATTEIYTLSLHDALPIFDLGSLGGAGTTSIAHDGNDEGAVVGLAETSTGRPHAFLWTAADGMRDLGALGAAPSIALGINNRREVVGGSGHAFLWTERAGIVDLGTLGGRTSCANDINDLGCIVGVSQTDRTDARGLPVPRAFLRTPDGSMLDLGTLDWKSTRL